MGRRWGEGTCFEGERSGEGRVREGVLRRACEGCAGGRGGGDVSGRRFFAERGCGMPKFL